MDAIVFDIQDGASDFTHFHAQRRSGISREAKKPVLLAHESITVGGRGRARRCGQLNFIATHPIVVCHGMTVGELAQMFNAENKIGADVRVVKMENWSRAMWFDETNQIWTNPSPNMRSLNQATLYPGIGLLEVTNVSVGRGTDTPFEIVGAPWLDGQKLCVSESSKSTGVRFVPIRFKPNASVFKDED